MPWTTPTLAELRGLNRDFIAAYLPGADASVPNSVLRVLSDANSGLAALTLQYLDWLARQLMVDTAEREWLDRFGQIWLSGRKAATFAEGTALLQGIAGTDVPSGTLLAAGPVEYETLALATLTGSPTSVAVRALTPGLVGNQTAGAGLTVSTAIPGLDAAATAGTIAGGVDAESDEDLRGRILDRIRKPPMGGDADDYVAWALEVPGVTRAWTSPMEMGAGSVTVRFMMDELRASNDGFPLPEDVEAVQAHIDALRPVSVKDLFVLAPISEPINFTISGLVTDSAETRFNLEAAVAAMLNERARPAYALNGVAQDAQTIHREWVSAAVLSASGVESFNLTMTDHVMPSKGHIAVPGTVTYA
ncbi:baseplate J/gp47 family protein [Bosea sp. BK604]|uniref:baseplate J/gp47 family protein n=1 Tax=Bosea sp. BK604 TaxID=2512180 RepID=UPI00104FDE4A|nr:baseplate J/gp47 family protein [Bosea sp. BK604]TCR60931.1 putative phage protein gp47/JayE [Bosea sp. BK604]